MYDYVDLTNIDPLRLPHAVTGVLQSWTVCREKSYRTGLCSKSFLGLYIRCVSDRTGQCVCVGRVCYTICVCVERECPTLFVCVGREAYTICVCRERVLNFLCVGRES